MKSSFIGDFNAKFASHYNEIKKGIDIFCDIIESDNWPLYVCGNGGSASTADHFVNDLNANGFPAVSLCSNFSIISAIANDFNYEDIFVKQLQYLCVKDVILFGISVSGQSYNILKAFSYAKDNDIATLSILGNRNSRLLDLSDHVIEIISYLRPIDFRIVESIHLAICHAIVDELVRRNNGT